MAICQYCYQSFNGQASVARHQALSEATGCKQKRDTYLKTLWAERRRRQALHSTSPANPDAVANDLADATNDSCPDATSDGDITSHSEDAHRDVPDEALEAHLAPEARYSQSFPKQKQAGFSFGESPTRFESIRNEEIFKEGHAVYGPFADEDEWELVKWLIKNVGHTQADKFLRLPIIRNRAHPAYQTKDNLLRDIDSLPDGVDWKCELVKLTGDIKDLDGNAMKEKVEFWFRNPLECIRELLGNPTFRDTMKYAPERHHVDKDGMTKVVSEMWTADWWWNLQELLPPGATIAPVILSSDKTKLSQFQGDKSAWPVRREASSHATVLIGYLPVAKLDCFTDKSRPAAKYRLFHYCMRMMLASIAQAGRTGETMTCADRQKRSIWPIVTAYVADYPEQCLVGCCMENRCPMCQIPPNRRGEPEIYPPRCQQETISLLQMQDRGTLPDVSQTRFKDLGLRPVYPPFWEDLPHLNVFEWFTPDLLHQLHKGVFKDHLVKWCTAIVGEDELDARFRAMSDAPGLRHFAHGISTVSQWTGREHKEMERVFLGVLIGRVDPAVVSAVRAVLDFIYLASLHSHTTQMLTLLQQSLENFHLHKQIFIELGARTQDHFNIPKMHAIEHYVAMILKFSSADGFNTESPERLHIDYAKDAYRASNHKDYTSQMVTWLRRQEAVDRFACFIIWCNGKRHTMTPSPGTAGGVDPLIGDDSRVSRRTDTYMRTQHPTFIPHSFDGLDLYARLCINLPPIAATSYCYLKNTIRASPPVPPHGRLPGKAARMDFALIRTGEYNEKTVGMPLEGLCVAHVRVIFTLPDHYPLRSPVRHPLAYIEWMTPFHRIDPPSASYVLTPSTRHHQPYGEIITVDRIVRNCHLWPAFGRAVDRRWSVDNVTELSKTFYFSPYFDIPTFCMLRLGNFGCVLDSQCNE
ncbi:hypothetical protein C8Q72DRAFT_875895 [Fomitopsis betulina]|nr:hypothetical protein C8Q72DRAFT_875895 [Fomitopsis betulina]